jgi:ABC-type nitrate/sulfonate/bicarbonate transport system ATPase subunit
LAHNAVVRGNLLSQSEKNVLINKFVEVENLNRAVGQEENTLKILHNVNFYANQGEIVSIVGPSGCGKSTFLNILAGLDQPDNGMVSISGIEPDDLLGNVGYMQQKDLLLPWRNVLGNVILGLEIQGITKKDARVRAGKFMEDFGLSGFENSYPNALSGGMRQRAAFLRTMLTDKTVFLLDEPFSSLDALNRASLQQWLLNLLSGFVDKTIVIVTHDVEEALLMSDRVYVMSSRPGTIQKVLESPFEKPRNRNIVNTADFTQLKSDILSLLMQDVSYE